MSDNIHSYHHLFFPFKWDVLPANFEQTEKKENLSFEKRTSLEEFENQLKSNSQWLRTPFKISSTYDYNEYSYFYSFVRKTLYDLNENSTRSIDSNHDILRYYEYQLNKQENNQYVIEYLIKENLSSILYLDVSGISLHVFNTGVAILSFSLINRYDGQDSADKILLINEFGRRIYPQFLGSDLIGATQKVFLAKSLKLILGSSIELVESFDNYKDLSFINPEKTFYPPKFVSGLFDEKKFLFHIESNLVESKILLSRVLDDRLFFYVGMGNNTLSRGLTSQKNVELDWWYAFTFGDKTPKSIANADLQKQQFTDHTYTRWLEYGTLYGMSRDSFVCISSDIKYMIKNNVPRIDVHMNTIYYQFVILCLAQKASILKFSGEIANLSDSAFEKNANNKLADAVKSIYSNYIEFSNKIYFSEVSSQIQAIEIYKKFQTIMSINNDVKDLNSQISTLFEYLSFEKEERQNIEAHKLTVIATWFLPATFIASLFGISFITDKTTLLGSTQWNVWIVWGIVIVLGGGITWLIFNFKNIYK